MTRVFLASIAVVTALAVVPHAVEAQKETPKKGALPKSNQVYVKVFLPTETISALAPTKPRVLPKLTLPVSTPIEPVMVPGSATILLALSEM